jgi:enediyne biosynthesis protein E4
MNDGFKRHLFILFICLALSVSSCQKDKEDPLFILLAPGETGIDFANTITENDSINLLDYEYVYNGGGVAVADINVDGLPDLFFSGNMVPSRLYLNQGNMRFKDITGSAGITGDNWATGVAVADVNADGFPDLYVCSAGKVAEEKRANLLYINNGDNTFTESAQQYGIDDTGFSTMAAFLDYDLDSDLDLYVLTYGNDTWNTNIVYPKVTDGSGKATDRFYRNNGDGTFTNISKEAGILIEGYGLGVSVCDINQDRWPDIYVSNDYADDDFIYINNHDGTFTESASKYLNHTSHFAMGNDVADFNNDGLADIVVVDMEPEDHTRQKLFSMTKNYDRFMMSLRMGYLPAYMRNTLQLNNGDGSFSEIGQLAGIHHTDWSWAPLLADLDNDGNKDLFVTNGYPKDIMNRDFLVYNKYSGSFQSVNNPTLEQQHRYRLQAINELQGSKVLNYLYRNNGDLTFSKMSEEWGFDRPTFSNGAAYADLDADGDLDLAINNINDPAFVYENRCNEITKNNYLRLKLVGDSLNHFALGATVKMYAGKNAVQYLEDYPYRGFQSTVESVLHFGMGTNTKADSIVIRWPDDRYTVLKDVPVNQILTLHQRDGAKRHSQRVERSRPFFHNTTEAADIEYVHKETDNNDFKTQPLLPHKLSQSGPGIAAADVNGDGLSDFYVGGSQQFPGQIHIQKPDGTFIVKPFRQNQGGDDTGCLFFDADGDGDEDLYIASGGNEQMAGTSYYQDHLYLNDGAGNFTHDPGALPKMFESGSSVVASDWDMDDDLDLFVGGRVHPGNYPLPGKSYLLRNDGGKFSDVTEEVAGPGFARMGMVNSALWTDYNNDRQPDLIVAGEWMPVTIFRNSGGHFTNVTSTVGLDKYTGWWNSIVSADFDNDGDTDYIFGNTGKNSPYKPQRTEPLTMYMKDFDHNGKQEGLLTYYTQGKQQTVHSRDEITDQINFMKKRFPRYENFANADFSSLLTREELKGSYELRCETFESIYLLNNGNGTFAVNTLPMQAQFAPLFGMVAVDGDDDGNIDVVAVGNSYATEISVGRYDACFGVFLKGDGKGNFKTLPSSESGFFLRGDGKGLATAFDPQGHLVILSTQNGGPVQAFGTQSTRKTLRPSTMDAYAEVILKNGKRRMYELQYGNTYLSQSDRVLMLPDDVAEVRLISTAGKQRVVRDW